jgi:hypothetical protein
MADTLARNLVPAFFVLASSSSTMSAASSRDALAVSLGVFVAMSLRFLQDVTLHVTPFTVSSANPSSFIPPFSVVPCMVMETSLILC